MNKQIAMNEMLNELENASHEELLSLAELGYQAYLESLDDLSFEEEYQYRVLGEVKAAAKP